MAGNRRGGFGVYGESGEGNEYESVSLAMVE